MMSLVRLLFVCELVQAASLASLCTSSNVKKSLPKTQSLNGIVFDSSSISAGPVYNASSGMDSSATYNYCNISVAYSHTNKNDSITVLYALPDPSTFEDRFYVAGGGGYSLTSSATGGLAYGAASGATSAGYDAFHQAYDAAALYGNGSINWDAAHMFGYQALGEMTIIGKALTRKFYGMSVSTKLYTYFEGCSDGGREAMSQVQRYGEEYDGVIAGAPAIRYAHQQVNHVFSSLVEHEQGYYPPPCELAKIVNATIAACDALDGREDGVVARTDLCMLNFNISSIIGTPFSCAASTSTSLGFGFSGSGNAKRQMSGPGASAGSTTSSTPAQNGTVSAQGVAVAQAILNGLHNSRGQRAYLSWQITSEFTDAATTYNSNTSSWELSIPSTGGEYVAKFVELIDVDNLSDLNNITYDTMVDWIDTAFTRYYDTLQTSFPDLTSFRAAGGKLLHYHGESDPSIPAASSVHYRQSVEKIMYPHGSTEDEMNEWYQLYLIPGAAHCGSNSLQPGPYPQDNMATMILWVEHGVQPGYLNASVTSGSYKGEVQQLCQWPRRPLWHSNSSSGFRCKYDQASIQAWTYDFPAFKLPVY